MCGGITWFVKSGQISAFTVNTSTGKLSVSSNDASLGETEKIIVIGSKLTEYPLVFGADLSIKVKFTSSKVVNPIIVVPTEEEEDESGDQKESRDPTLVNPLPEPDETNSEETKDDGEP